MSQTTQPTHPTASHFKNIPTQPNKGTSDRPLKSSRPGKGPGAKVAAVVVLVALGLAGYIWSDSIRETIWPKAQAGTRFTTHTVRRGLMRVTVTEDGNVESARNVDVKCLVEGGSTILEIVEEGKQVEAGTVLVKLDSSAIEEQLIAQRIAYEKARSLLIQAEEAFAVSKIAVKEYLEGTFEQELQLADAAIVIAKENLKNSEAMLSHSERMYRKGYINEQQLESNRFAVERSKLDLDAAETARKVLVEFTKAKTLKELESARESAEAQMLAEKAATELEKAKLDHLQEQLERCIIRAPQAGMVIYNHEQRRFGSGEEIAEGLAVRQNQTLIKLPDLSQLEVKVLVHETKVNKIAAGMPANVRIRDWRTHGTVVSVATQAEPGSWFSAQVKEYAAKVRIDDAVEDMGIKPGMTAEAEIIIAELPDVLTVPLLGVIQQGREYFCYVLDPSQPTGYSKRPVVVGMSNDREFEIKDGLSEGDRVILNPRATIPEARESAKAEVASGKGRPNGDRPEGKAIGGDSAAPGAEKKAPEAGTPEGKPAGPAAKTKPGLMSADQDGDGKISESEAPERMKPFFSKIDKNGDGFVDSAEANAAAQARAKQTKE